MRSGCSSYLEESLKPPKSELKSLWRLPLCYAPIFQKSETEALRKYLGLDQGFSFIGG